jgi:predicted Kef-type K+ transport protein
MLAATLAALLGFRLAGTPALGHGLANGAGTVQRPGHEQHRHRGQADGRALELESEHGKRVMGVLLFQDLAVVPLLVLIPALGASPERCWCAGTGRC